MVQTLSRIVQRNILALVLVPMMIFGLFFGSYFFLLSERDIEKANLKHTYTIGRYIDAYIGNALAIFDHLSMKMESKGLSFATENLSDLANSFPYFDRIVLIGEDGVVIRSSPEGSKGNVYPLRDPNATENLFLISKPTISPDTGHLVIKIDRLAYQSNRIVGELSLENLHSFIYESFPDEFGEIILTDHFGNVIVHPDVSLVRQQANIGHESMFLSFQKDNRKSFLFQNEKGYFIGSVQLLPNTQWLLFLYRPLANVLKPFLINVFVLLVGYILLSFAMITLLRKRMKKRVVEPIMDFSGHIESSKTNLSPYNKISKGGFKELSVLNDKFSELAIRINKREQELRESEEKYRNIFENAIEGIFRSSVDGRFIYTNPAYAQMLGYTSPDELVGSVDSIQEELYINPELRQEYLDLLRQKGRISNFEVQMRKKDGTTIWTSISAWAIEENGEFAFIEGITEDITRRREAEEKLKWEMAFTEKTINALNDTFFVFDIKDGKALRWNDAFRKTSGYSDEEIKINKAPESYYDSEDLERAAKFTEQLVAGKNNTLEMSLITKSGERIPTEYTASIIDSDDEQFQMIVAIGRDITERKMAEAEIRAARNIISNIIDSMPSIIVAVNAYGQVTQWNRKAEENIGKEKRNVLGLPLEQVAPELADEMDRIHHAIESGQPLIASKRLKIKDSKGRHEEITIYPLMTDGEKGAVIRLDDVTDRVKLDQVMVQSEKMMSVGGLAAGMAHEINNPLSIIINSSQNIENRVFKDSRKNLDVARECGVLLENVQAYLLQRDIATMLKSIREAGSRASTIIRNMLSFSRKSEGNFDWFEIPHLLEQTVELANSDFDLKKKYDFKQIVIEREFEVGLPQVLCEANQIQQVFLNLFKNSAEAMAEKDFGDEIPRISLKTFEENDLVVTEIEDNGPGMNNDTAKRIFEPFFTTKPIGQGTGLGLSVSYFIVVDQHNGSMEVNSRLGIGSKFTIKLPVSGKQI